MSISKILLPLKFIIYRIIIVKPMSCLKNFIQNFILKADLFAATATLRYSGGSSYETYVGGCVSLLMVIGFALIFYSSFIDVLTKVNVISSIDI